MANNNGLKPGGKQVGEWDEWAVWVLKTIEEILEIQKQMAKDDNKAVVNVKLDSINDELKRTNDSLANHEKLINENIIKRESTTQTLSDDKNSRKATCPHLPAIHELEKEAGQTKATKKWVISALGVAVGVVTIAWIIFQLVTHVPITA